MRKAPRKKESLRERAETKVPPYNIRARVIGLQPEFHSTIIEGQQRRRHDAVLWRSETEELKGHDGLKSGEDVQR